MRVFLHIAEEVKAVREQRWQQVKEKWQQQVKDVLLKELSNSDINWLMARGHQAEIAPGSVLIEEGKVVDTLYIVLDGTLSVTFSQGKTSDWEIAQLGSGEIAGEGLFIGTHEIATTIKTLEQSFVLSIAAEELTAKFQQDTGFASRFTRAIAILLSDRLHSTISQLSDSQLFQDQPLRNVLFVLGELNDSDIDWLIASGTRQKITANRVRLKYFKTVKSNNWVFATREDNNPLMLIQHSSTEIKRYVKVKGNASLYDGDWLYWSTRMGVHPETPVKVAKLLKRQKGKCAHCGNYFKD